MKSLEEILDEKATRDAKRLENGYVPLAENKIVLSHKARKRLKRQAKRRRQDELRILRQEQREQLKAVLQQIELEDLTPRGIKAHS